MNQTGFGGLDTILSTNEKAASSERGKALYLDIRSRVARVSMEIRHT